MHVIDWYPTVAAMAGLPPAKMDNTGPMPVDGQDMWSAIKSGSASPRTEMVHSKCRLPWRLLSSSRPQKKLRPAATDIGGSDDKGPWSGSIRVGDLKL